MNCSFYFFVNVKEWNKINRNLNTSALNYLCVHHLLEMHIFNTNLEKEQIFKIKYLSELNILLILENKVLKYSNKEIIQFSFYS